VLISSKVALTISLVVAVAGAAATGVALSRQESERRDEFRRASIEALELLALAVAPAMAEGRHDRAQAVLDNIANFPEGYPDVRGLEVLDREGRVVADLDPRRYNLVLADADLAGDLALGAPDARPGADGELRVAVPLRGTHALGVMRARLSGERLAASIARQQRAATLFVVATMLLVGLALHFLHRRLVGGRLGQLARTAASFGRGRLDERAPAKGDDEIAELGGAFNAMAGAIKAYTEDLEHIIAERTDELEKANRRLEQLATTDALTGLCNRHHFDECARRAIEVARRNDRPLSVVLVDTDRFKSINDRFGHAVGDAVLQDLACVLLDNARKADLVARIGGEEFAIIMPETGLETAGHAAERMRAALEHSVHPAVPALGGEPVTASFGVAALESDRDRLEDLLRAADLAMYQSKSGGRNRVTLGRGRGGERTFLPGPAGATRAARGEDPGAEAKLHG
jgi:diguanylate cyclase (GGDEF)-like protein